jgi:hypothetical protein
MFTYKRLNSRNNAKKALNEILSTKAYKADLRFVIYELSKNHVECASDEGGPQAVRKYELSRETADAIRRDAVDNFSHAALAYNMRTNEVYLLDAVPDLAVANCLLLCVMNILVGTSDAATPSHAFDSKHKDNAPYVTAQPRPKSRAMRDPETGRFIRLVEDTNHESDDDDILGRRFRLGNRF